MVQFLIGFVSVFSLFKVSSQVKKEIVAEWAFVYSKIDEDGNGVDSDNSEIYKIYTMEIV